MLQLPTFGEAYFTNATLSPACLHSVTGLRSAANVSLRWVTLDAGEGKHVDNPLSIRCERSTFSETAVRRTLSELDSDRSASETASAPMLRQGLPGPARESSFPPGDSRVDTG